MNIKKYYVYATMIYLTQFFISRSIIILVQPLTTINLAAIFHSFNQKFSVY